MAMRVHIHDAALAYWGSTLDQPIRFPEDSVLWTSSLLGNANGAVYTGPFAFWQSIPKCVSVGQSLTRNWQSCPDKSTFLFSDRDIDYVLNKTSFAHIVPKIDTKFEDDHGAVHVCVGGHMGSLLCSPSDPIFFLHHTFIDSVWEEFRNTRQLTNIEDDYPTPADGDIGGEGHGPYDFMEPFVPLYNIHGISDHYTRYYYEYEPRPKHCQWSEDCESDYLWCDTSRGRCLTKVKAGGDCSGLPDEACHGRLERCVNNRCGAVDSGSWWRWVRK